MRSAAKLADSASPHQAQIGILTDPCSKLAVLRAQSVRETACVNALQSLIAAHFVIIVFWAFGLDLTIDAVTKLAPETWA